MSTDQDQRMWDDYLNGFQAEQLDSLVGALKRRGAIKNGSNGKANLAPQANAPKRSIEVRRQPTDNFYVRSVPKLVDTYGLYDITNKLATAEPPKTTLLKGPKGEGKSLLVATIAYNLQAPRVLVQCTESTKSTTLFGSFGMEGDKTFFSLGLLPTAVDIANETGFCILQFEEINALPPQEQKKLNLLLDWQKTVVVEGLNEVYTIQPNAKIWVVGTMNPSVYGGTYDLNEDLRSRCREIEIGYPPFGQEKAIIDGILPGSDPQHVKSILNLATETRKQVLGYALSTRDVVAFLEDVKTIGIKDALSLLAFKFEGEDRNTIIPRIHAAFGVTPPKTWGAAP